MNTQLTSSILAIHHKSEIFQGAFLSKISVHPIYDGGGGRRGDTVKQNNNKKLHVFAIM